MTFTRDSLDSRPAAKNDGFATRENDRMDFNTFGRLFESLCIRDLRTYAEAIDATVFHYRDARGLECDAIIEFADGRWGLSKSNCEQINSRKQLPLCYA
jgi:hypothetical protein